MLKAELLKIHLEKIEKAGELRLFGGLLALLRILDEKSSENLIKNALTMDLTPATLSVLNSTKRFSNNNYRISTYCQIDIYESKALDQTFEASQYVEQWLRNVPQEDLKNIPRIYIEPEDNDTRYLGTYEPHIACIKVIWQANFRFKNPINSLFRFFTELVLYHEIGHHFHGHTYGQIPEQEKEADQYSYKIIKQSHPKLATCGKFIRNIFKHK